MFDKLVKTSNFSGKYDVININIRLTPKGCLGFLKNFSRDFGEKTDDKTYSNL